MAIEQMNIPVDFSVQKFVGEIDRFGSVAKGCRFAVRILPSNQSLISKKYGNEIPNLTFVCDSAELPGRGFVATEARYYGPGQQFPNNTVYNPLNLSFVCRTKSVERQIFDDWMDVINPTTSFNFNYPQQYYSDVEVIQFAEYGKISGQQQFVPEPVYYFKLRKAYPITVQPQPVTWADEDVLRLQVQFQYKYWDRLP